MHPRFLNSPSHITLADLLLFRQGPTRLFNLVDDRVRRTASRSRGSVEPRRLKRRSPARMTRRPREIVRAAGEQRGRRCDGVEALAKQPDLAVLGYGASHEQMVGQSPFGVPENGPVLGGPFFPPLDHDDVPTSCASRSARCPRAVRCCGVQGRTGPRGSFLRLG